MFLFIIGFIAFFYLVSRIGNLEIKVKELEQRGINVQPSKVEEKVSVMEETIEVPKMQEPVVVPEYKPYEPVKSADSNTEFALGSQVFTIVGVVALLIGVAFFLRYAFENNFITETMRVMFGLLLGAVLCSVGAWIRKMYVDYGSALFGAGLGVLYVSVYAAYDFYHMIGTGFAFVALILVTLIGLVAALVYDSLPLISYSLAGAFIITYLLPLSENVHTFFLYMIVLNALVIALTTFKRWPELTMGTIIASFFIITGWLVSNYNDALFVPVSFYLTLICGSYSISVISNFLRKRGEYKDVDGFLLPAIPVVYVTQHYILLHSDKERALLFAFIGAVYLIGFGIVKALAHSFELANKEEHTEGRACSNSMFLIGSMSIAAAVGLHFEGLSVSYLWALQALVLVGIGSMLKSKNNRVFGIVLSILSLVHMYGYDYFLSDSSSAIFNSRTVISFVMTIVFATIYAFYKFYEKNDEDEYVAATGLGIIASIGIPLIWLTIEIQQFVHVHTSEYLALTWTLYALAAFTVGLLLKEAIARYGAYVLAVIGVFLGLIEASIPQHVFLFNFRVLVVGVAILVLSTMVMLFKAFKKYIGEEEYQMSTLVLVGINFLALWLGTFEISDYFQGQLSNVLLSLYYLVYGAAALTLGIMLKSYFARVVAFILFGISIFKIFLFDTANLSDVYRFVSFITLGVILLVSSYAYYRFKDRIQQFIHLDK